MAQTIQVITKQGGKITNVTVATTASSAVSSDAPTETIDPSKGPNKGFKSKKK